MWTVFLILLELFLFTQTVLNLLKIFEYFEALITSKKTSKLINEKLDIAFDCKCNEHFKEEK